MSYVESVKYKTFEGKVVTAKAYIGDNIALVVPTQATVSKAVMDKIVASFDGAWDYYYGLTGVKPIAYSPTTIDGRSTVAVVASSFGNAGSGYLGFNGIELIYDYFGSNLRGSNPSALGFYDTMKSSGTLTSIVFYELGRNFWFYDQLENSKTGDNGFTTGFAVANRYFALQAAGVKQDVADDTYDYNRTKIGVIAQTYFSDRRYTANTTLAVGKGVENPTGYKGTADLAASLLRVFHDDIGESDYKAFWQALGKKSAASSDASAFKNFTVSAKEATGLDFSFLWKLGWTYLAGNDTSQTLQSSGSGSGKHAVLGFGGNDAIKGSQYGETLVGGSGIDKLWGYGGSDQLIGGSGNDQLYGDAGNDILHGGSGNDIMSGGTGNDTYVIDSVTDRVIEKSGASEGNDTIRSSVTIKALAANVEKLVLTGTANISGTGNALANTIAGNSGDNTIDGGLGKDVLTGGLGKDTFLFKNAPIAANLDHIKDFSPVDDSIALENAIFKGLTKTGMLESDAFATVTSKTATVDGDVRVLYDKAKGALYYDPDGGSAAGRVAIALLDNHANLTSHDILVV